MLRARATRARRRREKAMQQPPSASGRLRRRVLKRFVAAGLAPFAAAWAAPGSPPVADASADLARALRRASDAVVGLVVRAVEGARSAATLGRVRAGSGVVIGEEGLVLTIASIRGLTLQRLRHDEAAASW
jgi:hypothetical protein